MDIAEALAVIDRLCSGAFPAARTRTDTGWAGPGYRTAELATSEDFWEDDGTRWRETADQYACDRDGLAERLAERWGPPQEFSLYGVLLRSAEEEAPQPWGPLSGQVPDVQLWRSPEAGRWIVLGVGQQGRELPFQLLAVVTDVDPP
ncbi:hypothetical protein ACWEGQ_33220 [Streptomyces seoulensis]